MEVHDVSNVYATTGEANHLHAHVRLPYALWRSAPDLELYHVAKQSLVGIDVRAEKAVLQRW